MFNSFLGANFFFQISVEFRQARFDLIPLLGENVTPYSRLHDIAQSYGKRQVKSQTLIIPYVPFYFNYFLCFTLCFHRMFIIMEWPSLSHCLPLILFTKRSIFADQQLIFFSANDKEFNKNERTQTERNNLRLLPKCITFSVCIVSFVQP